MQPRIARLTAPLIFLLTTPSGRVEKGAREPEALLEQAASEARPGPADWAAPRRPEARPEGRQRAARVVRLARLAPRRRAERPVSPAAPPARADRREPRRPAVQVDAARAAPQLAAPARVARPLAAPRPAAQQPAGRALVAPRRADEQQEAPRPAARLPVATAAVREQAVLAERLAEPVRRRAVRGMFATAASDAPIPLAPGPPCARLAALWRPLAARGTTVRLADCASRACASHAAVVVSNAAPERPSAEAPCPARGDSALLAVRTARVAAQVTPAARDSAVPIRRERVCPTSVWRAARPDRPAARATLVSPAESAEPRQQARGEPVARAERVVLAARAARAALRRSPSARLAAERASPAAGRRAILAPARLGSPAREPEQQPPAPLAVAQVRLAARGRLVVRTPAPRETAACRAWICARLAAQPARCAVAPESGQEEPATPPWYARPEPWSASSRVRAVGVSPAALRHI